MRAQTIGDDLKREIKVSSVVFEVTLLLLIDSIHFMFMNNYLTSSIFVV